MEKLVSIIAPVYKIPENYLKHSIDCMVEQTYKNIEIILIDDGSPDNCGEICDEKALVDSRIKVIHTPNAGVSSARNTGISNATGDYIVFVDSDDYVYPEIVEKLLTEIEAYNADLAVCNYMVSGSNTQGTGKTYVFDDESELGQIQKSFIGGKTPYNLRFTGAPWAKMYNKYALKESGCLFDTELPRSQDNEFNFRFMKNVKKCIFVDEVLYTYNVFGESAMRKYWPKAIGNAQVLFDKLLKDLDSMNADSSYYEILNLFVFTKLEDILYTNIMHPKNEISFKTRVSKLKKIMSEKMYSDSVRELHKEDFKSYRKLLLLLLKKRCYTLACLVVGTKVKIRSSK